GLSRAQRLQPECDLEYFFEVVRRTLTAIASRFRPGAGLGWLLACQIPLEVLRDRPLDPAHIHANDDDEQLKGKQKVNRLEDRVNLLVAAAVEIIDVKHDAVGNLQPAILRHGLAALLL